MIIVVMGVTGCGKTTVGRRLAERLSAEFIEGDQLHSAENVRKMSAGLPLGDADRRPWLEAIARRMRRCIAEGRNAVVACSALKASYRRVLAEAADLRLVYLKATEDLVRSRLSQRSGHFMPATLIDSQFADLEEPDNALTVDASQTAAAMVDLVIRKLGLN
jgi:gluconokinase